MSRQRTCRYCGSSGPFYGERRGNTCAECIGRQAKAWRAANPERARLLDRRGRIKRFGLTLESYDALLAAQGGRCVLCPREPLPNRHLPVDHDHETGEVRGLLCDRCNVALGRLGDSAEALARVLDYLRNPPARAVLAKFAADQEHQLDLLEEAA